MVHLGQDVTFGDGGVMGVVEFVEVGVVREVMGDGVSSGGGSPALSVLRIICL